MAKSKSVTTRVWVSRDKLKNKASLGAWIERPSDSCGVFYGVRKMFRAMSVSDFQRLTGLRLKPGECRQVDMTISMVPVEGGE